MKCFLPLVIYLLPLALFAQKQKAAAKRKAPKDVVVQPDSGVQFVRHLTWSEVQRKAKAENKYIFMNCFSTGSDPCLYMNKTIFPQKSVGDAVNDKFIAVNMQLDTTDADNADVKSQYATAHAMARNYIVTVYPTYLFFNPDGELVHRAVGSSEADGFIAKTEDALNPQKQYYTLLKAYQKGQKDSAFLHRLTMAAMHAYDRENVGRIADDYFATQANLYTADNLLLMKDLTQSSADKGFQVMLANPAKVDSVLGKGSSRSVVQPIILREEVYPRIIPKDSNQSDTTEPGWQEIDSVLGAKYPAQAASLSAYSRVLFYKEKREWDKYGQAVVAYMKAFGEEVSDAERNEFAWSVFQNCSNEEYLQSALSWSRRSFGKEANPAFMDTYANLLYRLGKKDEALMWEQKALDLVPDADKTIYQQTIDKMKAGEKTWN